MRVLHLARNYPNSVFPRLGLWTRRIVQCCGAEIDRKVVAPVPYFPPVPGYRRYARFRGVERRAMDGDVEVVHPRFVTGPGYSLHALESIPYFLGTVTAIDAIQARFPFDLIHAHFIYPDGVVAAALARRYGVPLVVTEQAPWKPWLDDYPLVRRQARWAARRAARLIAVSRSLRDSMLAFTGVPAKISVIPNVLDTSEFFPAAGRERRSQKQVLFVGLMRYCKGVDVLFRSIHQLLKRGRDVRLTVVGDGFYESYRREEMRLHRMVVDLGIQERVEFVGGRSPREVASFMRRSDLLVLPSRAESFGAVLVEALGCGIPVVATRCGGPEEIVNEEVGVLVSSDDPDALGAGIERVLGRLDAYDPVELSRYARGRFGPAAVGRALEEVYGQVLARPSVGPRARRPTA